MHLDDDDNEDLSQLDRGNEVTEANVRRDKGGRFAKKAETVEVEEVKLDEVKLDAEKPEAKEEAEEEETVVASDEEDDDDEEDEGKGKQNFPVRLNKAKKQRDKYREELDQARLRLAALEARLSAKEEAPAKEKVDPIKVLNEELDSLYDEVETARADGRSKDAAKLQRQIDEKNREISEIKADRIARTTSSQAQLDARYDAMVDILEASYPALTRGTDEYDADLVRDLEFQVAAYEKMGMNSPAALRKAATLLFREDPFAPKKKEAVKEVKEEKEEPEKKPEPKKTDPKKLVEASKKQPPDTSARGVNKDDQRIHVDELSDEEWDKLPASKKKELRGDFA